MELLINKAKKSNAQKLQMKNSLKVKKILRVSDFLLVIGILFAIVYGILNALIPEMNAAMVMGQLKKDVVWIVIMISFVLAPCAIFALLIRVYAKNVAGANNILRTDESLFIEDNQITYAYRMKNVNSVDERNVVTIQMNLIDRVEYDIGVNELTFFGEIENAFYMDYSNKAPDNVETIHKFSICDYFEPTIIDVLKDLEVDIIMKG